MHTILLVEDEAPLRELICDYLTAKSGGEWRVLPAADGTEDRSVPPALFSCISREYLSRGISPKR